MQTNLKVSKQCAKVVWHSYWCARYDLQDFAYKLMILYCLYICLVRPHLEYCNRHGAVI